MSWTSSYRDGKNLSPSTFPSRFSLPRVHPESSQLSRPSPVRRPPPGPPPPGPRETEGLPALPSYHPLLGVDEPSSLLRLKEEEGPTAAPEEAQRGPTIPRTGAHPAGPRGHGGRRSLSVRHCGSLSAEQTQGLSASCGIWGTGEIWMDWG